MNFLEQLFGLADVLNDMGTQRSVKDLISKRQMLHISQNKTKAREFFLCPSQFCLCYVYTYTILCLASEHRPFATTYIQ